MDQATPLSDDYFYRRLSSLDPRFWATLLFGLVFLYGALTIDPSASCNDSGECAPILTLIAGVIGFFTTLFAAAVIMANTSRGSRLDPATGDLVWWQNRTRKHAGEHGRIHPSQIGRIRLTKESERADTVHLYNLEGVRQPYFDAEVIPTAIEKWAGRLVARWPHIRFEIIG